MILGLSGSPRSGATEYVCKTALGQLEELGYETEYWSVREKKINFCTHCDHCLDGVGCVFNDDLTSLYTLLVEAEAYVFATPVYNGSVSGQLKTLMDRTRGLLAKNNKVFRYKPATAVAVGGDRTGGQELAIQQIMYFFTMNGAVYIGGGIFGANIGASLWSKDTLDGVKGDEEGLRALSKSVKRIDWYLKERSL
jgi:multimeric flavodoxin WrbA